MWINAWILNVEVQDPSKDGQLFDHYHTPNFGNSQLSRFEKFSSTYKNCPSLRSLAISDCPSLTSPPGLQDISTVQPSLYSSVPQAGEKNRCRREMENGGRWLTVRKFTVHNSGNNLANVTKSKQKLKYNLSSVTPTITCVSVMLFLNCSVLPTVFMTQKLLR